MSDTSLSQQIEILADAEHKALLEGDFEMIGKLLDIKEELAAQLAESDLSAEELAPLKMKIQRNHALFDHALAGIRNVASRMGDLRTIRRSMNTYNAYGQRMTIDAPQKKALEKRA